MPDLHEWVTCRVDEVERIAEAARGQGEGRWRHETGYHSGRVTDERGETVVYDEGAPLEEEAAHIALNDPASVLRRCAADRKILAEHRPAEGFWIDYYACEGCGYDGSYCPDYVTDHVNDCPTLLALAEGYGLTEEQRAALDRPEKERPEPTGPSLVPTALTEAYTKAMAEAFLNTRPVYERLHVKVIGPAPQPMPDWLREDLGLPAPTPEPTPAARALTVLEPHLSALALYKPDPEATP